MYLASAALAGEPERSTEAMSGTLSMAPQRHPNTIIGGPVADLDRARQARVTRADAIPVTREKTEGLSS